MEINVPNHQPDDENRASTRKKQTRCVTLTGPGSCAGSVDRRGMPPEATLFKGTREPKSTKIVNNGQ
jgi:hypothetical protein